MSCTKWSSRHDTSKYTKDGVTPDMSEYPTKADYEDLQRKLQSLQDSSEEKVSQTASSVIVRESSAASIL